MNFKDVMKDDLNIFYDVDEFAVLAIYKGKDISIRFINDYEIEGFRGKVICVQKKDIETIFPRENITIDLKVYKIQNFTEKNENEWIVGIS